MTTFQITEIKAFMNRLLATDCFDSFLLAEASVAAAATYHIDGHINREFYTSEEWEDDSLRPYEFAAWKDMRGLCFQLIKGRRTPVSFKFVLHLMPEHAAALLQKEETGISAGQVRAFILNIKYDGSGLTLVTGTALQTFLPDHTPDRLWDRTVRTFLSRRDIQAQEL